MTLKIARTNHHAHVSVAARIEPDPMPAAEQFEAMERRVQIEPERQQVRTEPNPEPVRVAKLESAHVPGPIGYAAMFPIDVFE